MIRMHNDAAMHSIQFLSVNEISRTHELPFYLESAFKSIIDGYYYYKIRFSIQTSDYNTFMTVVTDCTFIQFRLVCCTYSLKDKLGL